MQTYFSYGPEPFTRRCLVPKTTFCGIDPPAIQTQHSSRRSQAAVVAQERNTVVFPKKTEHLWHRVKCLTQAGPEGDSIGNRAPNQLSESLLEGRYSRTQGTPRSSQATRLDDARRRVQSFGLDPRPLVKLPLQPLGPHRSIRQSMRRQDGERPAAAITEIALDTLPRRTLWISVTLVTSMTVHPPRTTARTRRP